MTPNRPYLLRALFDWICDNNCTPYLLVDATLEGVEVPFEHVNAGRIVLNASGTAVANFDISDERVSFNTRFSGRDTWINVPMEAVLAIYAQETQEGMTFAPSDYPDRKQRAEYADADADQLDHVDVEAGKKASLAKKSEAAEPVSDSPVTASSESTKPAATSPAATKPAAGDSRRESGAGASRKPNHLKIIK